MSGKGFGNKDKDHESLEHNFGKKSDQILSIPSMEELSNRNEVTDLKVISELYNKSGDKDSGEKKVFKDVVKFPTKFPLKVIGEKTLTFEDEVIRVVTNTLTDIRKKTSDLPIAEWESKIESSTKDTSGGKYSSITLKPYFRNADELYMIYDAVKVIKGVKYCI